MVEKSSTNVQIDNDRVRVAESRFAPGAETGFHRHERDYVVVPMTSGNLRIVDAEGVETLSPLTAGVAYTREAGVEHNVINDNPFEFVFVEVELK